MWLLSVADPETGRHGAGWPSNTETLQTFSSQQVWMGSILKGAADTLASLKCLYTEESSRCKKIQGMQKRAGLIRWRKITKENGAVSCLFRTHLH